MNAHTKILDAWMSLLDGNISVPVYRIDVPEEEEGNYVQLRVEGGTGINNKRNISDEFIVITDIVTIFENNIDGSVVDGIDAEIFDLVLPTSRGGALAQTSGMQILNVSRENFDYLDENDGTKKYYRKVSRYKHIVTQTA